MQGRIPGERGHVPKGPATIISAPSPQKNTIGQTVGLYKFIEKKSFAVDKIQIATVNNGKISRCFAAHA